jgi:hypothetical protein
MTMYRRIALLHLRPGVSSADVATLERELGDVAARLPAVRQSHLGRHLPNTVGGGDYTWDLAFADEAACPSWDDQLRVAGHDALVAHVLDRVDAVQFECTNNHVPEPAIANCVKRTLFIEVDRDAPEDRRGEFDRVLTGMPRYISAIRNWGYHRVDDANTVGPRRWTHVWEQEFRDLDGLRGDYMMNPYHWGYVDPWFDPESPTRHVAPGVAHVFCASERSILGWK